MTRHCHAHGMLLFLSAFLAVSDGFAAEVRESAAASVARGEAELALRQRKDVLREVETRARQLGVSVPASELTDILGRRAHLEIRLDRCRLGGSGDCRALETALAGVEASFLEKTGLSTREFRNGQREAPVRWKGMEAGIATPRGGAPGLPGIFSSSVVQTCSCAFTVYSSNRWMNRYWGLECNNHASHGFCSNNLDSAHSAGSGAMTGDIDLYFGGNHANRDCPDDHYTCFRGPSTDHSGAWGNTCSCDTWHSQYTNPAVSWYGGDLTDALEVSQLSTSWMAINGSCEGATVSVKEFIKENDPWCCDDPMGDLWITLPIHNGAGSSSGATSAQNCNGGSQSGVYPNCGTFGATIRVAYSCQTYEYTTDPNTCQGVCGSGPVEGTCSCAAGCYSQGTCCPDYQEVCCDPYPQWNGCLS